MKNIKKSKRYRKKHKKTLKRVKKGGSGEIKAGESYMFKIITDSGQITFIAKCLYYHSSSTIYFIVTSVFINKKQQRPNSVPSNFYYPLLDVNLLIYNSPNEFTRSYLFNLDKTNLSYNADENTFQIADSFNGVSIKFKKRITYEDLPPDERIELLSSRMLPVHVPITDGYLGLPDTYLGLPDTEN
jgi:hypothetical protein